VKVNLVKKFDHFPRYQKQYPILVNHILEKHVKGGTELLIGIMPEDTGEMKRQTKAVQIESSRKPGWGIFIGVDYWRHVNDGTIYIEGQHFVEQAVESILRGLRQDFSLIETFIK
jgi:hypothetical protein